MSEPARYVPGSLLHEMRRKSFHLLGLIIPMLCLVLPTMVSTILLLISTLVVVGVDIARQKNAKVRFYFQKFFGSMLRPEEQSGKNRFCGASAFFAGMTFTWMVFPSVYAVCGMVTLVLADTAAALVGKRYGRTPFAGKTLEGSAAFAATGCLSMELLELCGVIGSGQWGVFVGVLLATLLELNANTLRLNDNFTIPLAVAFCGWLL